LQLAEGFGAVCMHTYQMALLLGRSISRSLFIFKKPALSFEQAFSIGIGSLPLVTIISIFLGSVTVTQAVYQFQGFIPMRYLGFAVCKSLITELCPVVTSMVVSGRITTAIAAEIGSMKTSEQLDAMHILSLDPIRYLIIPKILAAVIMLPVLVIYSELMAFLGSIVTVVLTVDITLYTYMSGLRLFFQSQDLLVGVFKTAVFGGIIALVGSHFGFMTKGGAQGVGASTTRAVLVASVLILIFDFIIAFVMLR